MFLRECLPIVAGEENDLTLFVEFQLPENMKFLFFFERFLDDIYTCCISYENWLNDYVK